MERVEEILRTPPTPVRLLADHLAEQGFVVVDEFLPVEEVDWLRHDLEKRRREGAFHRASVGRGADKRIVDEQRRDEICWWEESKLSMAQQIVWNRLELLKKTLNRDLFLGLRSFEGHYAVYPKGAFYRKHVDQFQGDAARVLSLVLYLNERWSADDGGQLRIYRDGGEAVLLDVEPEPGRLVCFLSHRTVHEVLPTRRERYSFCGWFRTGAYPLGI
jgi:SM-20-related protein